MTTPQQNVGTLQTIICRLVSQLKGEINSQPLRVREGLPYHQEDEIIDTINFAATVGLRISIKKLVYSNFMGMMGSVSVIFETGATY